MPLDAKQIKSLIQQPEGTALDFKRDQYEFHNANHTQKANLLKDILAMANSWRGMTAYILIGVDETKGSPNTIVGIQNHLDDADLHQFVNGKTQRAVDFSYYEVAVDGATIGVIEIPLQDRPLYLKSGYGGLGPDVAFIRDGSSTRTATIDELKNMWEELATKRVPKFSVEWADISNRRELSNSFSTELLILDPELPESLIPSRRRSPLGRDYMTNPHYGRELISYTAQRAMLAPIGLCLKNTSTVAGKRIRFVGRILKSSTLIIRDEIDGPPSRIFNPSAFGLGLRNDDDVDIIVKELNDRWEIEVDFGDVRPGDLIWTDNELFVGTTVPCSVKLEGEFRGDNLPEPVAGELDLRIEVVRRAMEWRDIAPYYVDSD